MKSGILEALAPLRAESQRQVILITDGLIGFEHEVLDAISRRLPKGSRVHTVGVGSGVNRSLTLPAARAGRGVELVIGLGEDAEPFVQRLLARTNAPLLTDVEISGSAVLGAAPARIPDLFGGSPALVSIKLRPEGGEVIIRSRSADGEVEDRVMVRATAHGEGSQAVTTLYAREVVEDLELGVATGGNKAELDREIERFGIDFQISTRMTSWVAVSARQMVDPRAPRRNETMPQALPFGMSAEGIGLRPATAAPLGAAGSRMKAQSIAAPAPENDGGSYPVLGRRASSPADRLSAGPTGGAPPPPPSRSAPPAAAVPPPPAKKESLVDLAKRLLKPFASSEPEKSEEVVVRRQSSLPAPRRLNGKVRRQGKRLIIEIDVTSVLKWAPAGEARLELSNGTIVKAPVLIAMTTAEGEYGLGLIITLVLEVDERVGEPATVHLSNGGEVLEIVL